MMLKTTVALLDAGKTLRLKSWVCFLWVTGFAYKIISEPTIDLLHWIIKDNLSSK
jgi:hypothetical protein